MFIPVGLILHGLREIEDEHFRGLMVQQNVVHEAEMHDKRGHQLWEACTGPDACLFVIGNADWSSVRLDDVLVYGGHAPALRGASPYRHAEDPLGPPPHGFLAVCPGVHVLTATVNGQAFGRAFRLAPRAARFVSVDPRGAFVDYEVEQEKAFLARLGEGTLSLFDYSQTVAAARMAARASRSNHEAHLRALPDLLEAYGCLARGDFDAAWAYARRAQIMLTGAPIPSFERIVKLVTDRVTRLTELNRTEDLRAWLELANWVVPDLPEIEAARAALPATP